MIERPERLPGATYKLKMQGSTEIKLYLTINHIEKQSFTDKLNHCNKSSIKSPYEIFINTKNAEIIEHTVAITILISKGLQHGETLSEIADSLLEIASPFTSHMKKGGLSKSMYARIGETLIEHELFLKGKLK